ncbi:MAG TPA: sigma-70 family RNA polymerase sigma factor [Caldilineaceae bacterium]|nr:sigma-70 family RNA polymerase sigma factor [Caldilineaceae bacterium]
MTTISNEQLILRCRRGDNRAWQQLVERYARLVHSIPVRYGLSAAEVDDVGQEVFLALAQGLTALDDPESLPAWLITTARRYSWRVIQKRKRENPLQGGDLAATEIGVADGRSDSGSERVLQHFGRQAPSMTELLEGWQRQELLANGLERLGDRCRELLTLVFLDPSEPSYEDISAQLGIAKGSIGPTRNRCLQQLRTILEGLGFDEPQPTNQ